MDEIPPISELAEREHLAHRPLTGLWRPLYAQIIQELKVDSVAELGAGSPDLLEALEQVSRRVAIDGGTRWREKFLEGGIAFHLIDLNSSVLPALKPFQAVVCTDVLEHLLFPRRVLEWIAQTLLTENGILISHVPNEFTLRRNLGIMTGRRDAVYFHPELDEDADPHLRRFTRIGFQRLLQCSFRHNRSFSELNYSWTARSFARCRFPVPYCLQPGPTYISTNSDEMDLKVRQLLRSIPHRGSKNPTAEPSKGS